MLLISSKKWRGPTGACRKIELDVVEGKVSSPNDDLSSSSTQVTIFQYDEGGKTNEEGILHRKFLISGDGSILEIFGKGEETGLLLPNFGKSQSKKKNVSHFGDLKAMKMRSEIR